MQIVFNDAVYKIIERESRVKHRTFVDVIRDRIQFRSKNKKARLIKRMESAFGLWRSQKRDVQRHVDSLRKDRKPYVTSAPGQTLNRKHSPMMEAAELL
jgi:hypothetical protein